MKNLFIISFIAVSLFACSAHGSIFWQQICDNSACTKGCSVTELPQYECIQTTNGGSAVCKCEHGELVQDLYPFQPNCTDWSQTQEVELDTCVMGDVGYVEYACPAASAAASVRVSRASALIDVGVTAVQVDTVLHTLPAGAVRRLASLLAPSVSLENIVAALPKLSTAASVRRSSGGGSLEVKWSMSQTDAQRYIAQLGDSTLWTVHGVHGDAPLNEPSAHFAKSLNLEQTVVSSLVELTAVGGTLDEEQGLSLRVDTASLRSLVSTPSSSVVVAGKTQTMAAESKHHLHGFALLMSATGAEIMTFVW